MVDSTQRAERDVQGSSCKCQKGTCAACRPNALSLQGESSRYESRCFGAKSCSKLEIRKPRVSDKGDNNLLKRSLAPKISTTCHSNEVFTCIDWKGKFTMNSWLLRSKVSKRQKTVRDKSLRI
eukprot:3115816-Amphidinium_carterae.1